MFKKFTPEENITGHSQVKSSVQRKIRSALAEQFPTLEENLDELLPKKSPVIIAKSQGHVQILVVDKEPIFFNIRDGPYFPTLRILHKYPDIMPKMRVDRGAIKFVLSGANIMCPGLTSPGGQMDDVPAESAVCIMAEGKETALAVGLTKMSTDDIRKINKGIAIENIHCLNDGFWKVMELD
eukprot:jgi/Chlat1/8465/Chrsp80S07862